jgi:hypothetical protein
VRDVVVNGEAIVEGRRSVRVDGARVHARSREEAVRVWERMA